MLETLLTSPEGFGLETASFMQRAICRLSDGQPLEDLLARGSEIEREAVRRAVGCDPLTIPSGTPPQEVIDLEPVRCGKSLREAARAFTRSQTVDVSIIKPGEEPPRISLLATHKDTAATLRGHLNIALEKPALKKHVIGETAEGIVVRHPSGLPIEIKVIAAHRGGYSLASRWSAGVIFDEAPGWYSTDKIISLEENRDQALGRLLPGAQAIYTGSPWQPSGFCFDAHAEHFGRPSADIVVIKPATVDDRTPAEWLNPAYWTPERVARIRKTSPRSYKMHICNEFGGSTGVFDMDAVDRAFGLPAVEYEPCIPSLVMDPSSGRKDSWTWALCAWIHPKAPPEAFIWEPLLDHRGDRITAQGSVAKDERGRPKMNPSFKGRVKPYLAFWGISSFDGEFWDQIGGGDVVDKIAKIAHRAQAGQVISDQREAYMMEAEFKRHRLRFRQQTYTAASKEMAVSRVRRWLADGSVAIQPHDRMRSELLNFIEVPTPGGNFSFKGRGSSHDDFVCLLLTAAMADAEGLLYRSPLKSTGPSFRTTSLDERFR